MAVMTAGDRLADPILRMPARCHGDDAGAVPNMPACYRG